MRNASLTARCLLALAIIAPTLSVANIASAAPGRTTSTTEMVLSGYTCDLIPGSQPARTRCTKPGAPTYDCNLSTDTCTEQAIVRPGTGVLGTTTGTFQQVKPVTKAPMVTKPMANKRFGF